MFLVLKSIFIKSCIIKTIFFFLIPALRWNKDNDDWKLSTFVTFVKTSKLFEQLLVFKKRSRKQKKKNYLLTIIIDQYLFKDKRFIPLVKLFNKLSDALWKRSLLIVIDEGLIFSARNL